MMCALAPQTPVENLAQSLSSLSRREVEIDQGKHSQTGRAIANFISNIARAFTIPIEITPGIIDGVHYSFRLINRYFRGAGR